MLNIFHNTELNKMGSSKIQSRIKLPFSVSEPVFSCPKFELRDCYFATFGQVL